MKSVVLLRAASWLGGLSLAVTLVGCGGSVSASGDKNSGPGDAGPVEVVRECATAGCGPKPGRAAQMCPDKVSSSGPTGRCVATAGQACAWEISQCPASPAGCFDANGNVPPSSKACTTDADCQVVYYTEDCCGTQRLAGVNKQSVAQVTACTADRASKFPGCGCESRGSVTDDGSRSSSSPSLTVIHLECTNHQCVTSISTNACINSDLGCM